jgi:hypothetical protein
MQLVKHKGWNQNNTTSPYQTNEGIVMEGSLQSKELTNKTRRQRDGSIGHRKHKQETNIDRVRLGLTSVVNLCTCMESIVLDTNQQEQGG